MIVFNPPPVAQALISLQEKRDQYWRHHIVPQWQRLNSYQKLYLIATFSLVIHIPTAAALTLVALIVDFWPRFARMWSTLAGKAVVLIFYAAATNFALASAAGLVNNLTGLDASYFPYAHYTAILLSLPGWVFGISIVFLVLLQLLFPLYMLVILGFRLVGIRSTQIFKTIQYPVITMCLRFALSLLIVIKAVDFAKQLDDTGVQNGRDNEEIVATSKQKLEPSTESEEGDARQWANIDSDGSLLLEGSYDAKIRQLLAHFIFLFEANKKSRCELGKNVRSVELNAYQHVEIRKDRSRPEGYQFSVKACKSPGIPAA